MSTTLLPPGFFDQLCEDAALQRHVVDGLLDCFEANGYQPVNPPLIEYEASLLMGTGASLDQQTFRVMDPLSHKMMGVRADMTAQIARIAISRLHNEPRPLRLSYAGPVLRVKSEDLYASRQLLQAGIELVGADSAHADAEVVLVALEALTKLGVQGLCVDFTLPRLAGIILEDLGFTGEAKQALLQALDHKNMASITSLAGKHGDILMQLAKPGITIKELKRLKISKAANGLCKRLEEVMDIVKASAPTVPLSLDPVESLKFPYHTGIGFSIFAQAAKEELGRGGRYPIDQETDAVGATLYGNHLLRVLQPVKAKQTVFIPLATPDHDITRLHGEGKRTIRSVSKSANGVDEARRLGCQAIWTKGKCSPV